ncbi:2-succinylbenzoate--CoA ligase, chloroplastic/peroxisomal isoform X3 [Actinidia eriantha]|uniref:2-succinylbenzoate--CoA ligase, chloroplastic/peroxisomal isoform X3 n=1 Tax=Actinidia eriantha TaxID=165200 RepID=UPI00258A012D|nr:2-succinylbenzoate--CoA ligase, chloroplastic/peroxisomal isoform X3 [Actinidia eriantha]
MRLMSNYSDAHICQCLSRLATLRRDSPVTIAGDRQKTGEQFVDGVLGLARGLLELGLRNGQVVAVCALNSDWYLEWLLSIAFVGGIAAPLNYRWSMEEARHAMEDVRPIMLVTDECSNYWYFKLQEDSIPSLRWHVFMNSPPNYSSKRFVLTTETLKKPAIRPLSLNYSWAPECAAIICFTSGTTGRPKGVTISHSALVVQSLAKIAVVGYGEDDVYLHTVPLCHIGGMSSATAILMVGGCHVLIPKFEAISAVEAVEQLHVTSFITVPAIMADIISLISFWKLFRKKEMWRGKEIVTKILNGGGGLSVEQIKDATVFFPRAKLLSAYGMTEACSSLTFLTLYDPTSDNLSQSFHINGEIKSSLVHQPGAVCVGKPAPHIELKIITEDSSGVGKILTRGPHVMLGYWAQISPKTSDTCDEGWFDTGDIGKIDEYGNVWLIGRSKGRIKTGGENVYPEEVEGVLSQHIGVSSVVVVGVPDTRLTEMVVACVQLRENWRWVDSPSYCSAEKDNQTLTRGILQRFCIEKHLTRFKIPKIFLIWRKQFPLTTTGKLKRDEVRREVMSCMQFLSSNL